MSNAEKLIAAGWAQYVEALPANASSAQLRVTRRAFYAGAALLLALSGLDPGEEPTGAFMARMAAIQRELMEFAADIGAGRA